MIFENFNQVQTKSNSVEIILALVKNWMHLSKGWMKRLECHNRWPRFYSKLLQILTKQRTRNIIVWWLTPPSASKKKTWNKLCFMEGNLKVCCLWKKLPKTQYSLIKNRKVLLCGGMPEIRMFWIGYKEEVNGLSTSGKIRHTLFVM